MTNKYNKHILAAAMLMVGGAATAQNLNSAYFTDQYAFRHTMNPATVMSRTMCLFRHWVISM